MTGKQILYTGALSACVAWAGADEPATPNQYRGGRIVVTANRTQSVELSGTTRTLTAKEIEQSGARDLGEALDLLPGIYTRTGADGVRRVDIRGFRSRHVVLLLNGVPMNSTFDGQFDPSLIPVENISKVKVGYGNQSIQYGNGGLGGVINVITKSGESGLHGSASAEIGDGDQYIGRTTLSLSTNNVNVFIGASHAERDHYKVSDDFKSTALQDGKERENSDYKRDSVLSSVTVALSDEWELGVVGNYMQGKYGKPPIASDDKTFAKKAKYERVEDYEGFGGMITLNRTVKDGINMRSALFYNGLDEETRKYDDNTYSTIQNDGSFSQTERTRSWGGSFQVSAPLWTDALVSISTSLKSDFYESDLDELVAGGGGGGGGGGATLQQTQIDRTLHNATFGLEMEQKLFERWIFIGGYSQNWQKNDDGNTDTKGSYMLGTTCALTESTLLHASYAHQIRFPSIKQLYAPNDVGNPNLTVETSDNYELGITQNISDDIEMDITGFVRNVDDYIERPDSSTPNQNYEEYRFMGVETTLSSSLSEQLNLFAGYTYLHTEDLSSGSEKDELQNRPTHKIQLGANWRPTERITLNGNVQYIAGQYFYSRKAPLIKERYANYTLVNLRATYDLNETFSIYGGIDNLLDENYEQSFGFPREGRYLYTGIKASF